MNAIPKAFNWVKARCECSTAQTFLLLSEVVNSDVTEVQARKPEAKFELRSVEENKFVVSKSWDASGIAQSEAIAFELAKDGIAVKDVRSHQRRFLALPELTPEGDCKLRIDGEPELLELWQVSRKALEALFFGSS